MLCDCDGRGTQAFFIKSNPLTIRAATLQVSSEGLLHWFPVFPVGFLLAFGLFLLSVIPEQQLLKYCISSYLTI